MSLTCGGAARRKNRVDRRRRTWHFGISEPCHADASFRLRSKSPPPIRYLDEHAAGQPGLAEVARAAGLSECHFQRLFQRWAGVSPKRFLQHLNAGRARDLLLARRTVLDAALETGLSGPGRLHDLMVSVHALTPGEVRTRGAGRTIRWGLHPSPFGECQIAVTDRGICGLAFTGPDVQEDAIASWRKRWAAAEFRQDEEATQTVVDRVFSACPAGAAPLPLLVSGTNFQIKVWEALLSIPPGRTVFYEDVARAIGRPEATRAVASAVG